MPQTGKFYGVHGLGSDRLWWECKVVPKDDSFMMSTNFKSSENFLEIIWKMLKILGLKVFNICSKFTEKKIKKVWENCKGWRVPTDSVFCVGQKNKKFIILRSFNIC